MDTKTDNATLRKEILSIYDSNSMDLPIWLNYFEFLIDLIELQDNNKGPFLLNMLKPSVIKKIQENVSPSDPYNLSYDKLVSVLDKLFTYPRGINLADYCYMLRDQFPFESIQHYVRTLRRLFFKCTPTIKNTTNMKDRFLIGLYDKETKKFLENNKNTSFGMVVAIAKQKEFAMKRSGELFLE
ncbi:hypothetical protein M0804_013239 [Polistes exclamans]|nr:hypothetical protein M0804_013239 [Polistes exclamans]